MLNRSANGGRVRHLPAWVHPAEARAAPAPGAQLPVCMALYALCTLCTLYAAGSMPRPHGEAAPT